MNFVRRIHDLAADFILRNFRLLLVFSVLPPAFLSLLVFVFSVLSLRSLRLCAQFHAALANALMPVPASTSARAF
jgi:hypothetical protein